jgi:hypothetical protein
MSLKKWAVCTNNDGYPSSLERRKLYQVVPNDTSDPSGWLRVIDESGEDYLYSANRFMMLQVEAPVEEQLLALA